MTSPTTLPSSNEQPRSKRLLLALKLLAVFALFGLVVWLLAGSEAAFNPNALFALSFGGIFVGCYAICRSRLSWRWKTIPWVVCAVMSLSVAYFIWETLSLVTPRKPPRQAHAGLRHAATILCEKHFPKDTPYSLSDENSVPIPAEEWPEAIAALRPRRVFARPNRLVIMVSSGGTTALPWGYSVTPDTVSTDDDGIGLWDTAGRR